MFFVPHTQRWLQRLVHIRPLYRYSGVIISLSIIIGVWRFGCYELLIALIHQKQATLVQLQGQLIEHTMAARHYQTVIHQLSLVQNACTQQRAACLKTACSDQYAYIYTEVQKAGLMLLGYHTEKEKQQAWKQRHYRRIIVQGSLQQIDHFLKALQQSERLIQCTSLLLQHGDGILWRAECLLHFIIL